ncbi:MAG TPA: class I SAM-dependent methyltransferase [Gemmatimonadales bacterium]|nr:class I SAM-dependent methyltransferase [Gemmatimonadales bacterium]
MAATSAALDGGATGSGITLAPTTTVLGDPLTNKTRAVWTAGDFERIAAGYRPGAEAFMARLGIRAGERVLDVACGTGSLTLPPARLGARATGMDIAANLLVTARERAAAEGLTVAFDEGNAEEMSYPDAAFDIVVSMFGAMFAPRPERVAAELLRVTRPGGRIAMANWTPGCFIGAMLRAHTALVPPPSGVPSTLLWGDEAVVRERLAGMQEVTVATRTIEFSYPASPAGVVALFREWYGPTIRTFEALDANGRTKLFDDLLSLWSEHNLATDGTTRVESEYLEVVAFR